MKLDRILEARARPGTRKAAVHYHAEFSGDGTGDLDWSPWHAERVRSFETAIENAKDEYNVHGHEYQPGVWIGRHFNDVEFNDEATEEGPWRSAYVSGEVCIIIDGGELEEGHPLFRKVQKDVNMDVSQHIEAAAQEDRDASEERSNPDRFYGVSRSDFR